MKKYSSILAAVVFLVGMTFSIQAEEIEITFDEDGIFLDDIITTQYQDWGVVWSDTYANLIVDGSETYYNHPFNSEEQILNFTDNEGMIQLDAMADALSFEFRRPSNTGDIYLEIYDSTAGADPVLVNDFGRIGWDGPDWEVFTYDGEYGEFDLIHIHSANKFVMDNLVINMIDDADVIDTPADAPADTPVDDEGSSGSDISCFISSLW